VKTALALAPSEVVGTHHLTGVCTSTGSSVSICVNVPLACAALCPPHPVPTQRRRERARGARASRHACESSRMQDGRMRHASGGVHDAAPRHESCRRRGVWRRRRRKAAGARTLPRRGSSTATLVSLSLYPCVVAHVRVVPVRRAPRRRCWDLAETTGHARREEDGWEGVVEPHWCCSR